MRAVWPSYIETNGPSNWGSIPGWVMPKSQKMVLDSSLLKTLHYKLWIKGKWSNPGKGVVPSSTSCSSYWKGAFGLPSTMRLIGLVDRVFANGPGDLGSIPGRVIPKTLKMVLDTSLLNTQQYKVCIKGKVEKSRERSSALPDTSVYSLLKRETSGLPRLRSPTLLYLWFALVLWHINRCRSFNAKSIFM